MAVSGESREAPSAAARNVFDICMILSPVFEIVGRADKKIMFLVALYQKYVKQPIKICIGNKI